MFEKLEFQGKLWEVKAKVDGNRIDDPSTLKKSYGADMVIRNSQNIYFKKRLEKTNIIINKYIIFLIFIFNSLINYM